MKSFMVSLLGLVLSVSVGAEPLLKGRVWLASGPPAAGVHVRLFDLTDLRRSVGTTTDEAGHFALRLQALSTDRRTALPQDFALGQNYPNPFNPSTIIPYQIPTTTHVRLEVFNLLGQRLATLVDGERPAGAHTAHWDATDAAGRAVGAGVFIYRLTSGGHTVSRRMVLIDGQAGIPAGGPGPMQPAAVGVKTEGSVYGLTVAGAGLIAYVDPAFRVGTAPVNLVLEQPGGKARMKVATGGILGDVNNDSQVDAFDAVYVALYSKDPSITLPNHGDISLGDVNGDGTVDLADGLLLALYTVNPSDPTLPPGIGQPVDGGGDDHGDTPSAATPLAVDSSQSGQIETGGDVDYFRVQITASGELTVHTTGSLDTKGQLEDSAGAVLASNDDGGEGYNFRLAHAVSAGTYYIKVEGYNASTTGRYTIHASGPSGGDGPDLIVASASVSDNTLTPAQSFTLNATVRNQGTAAAAAATVHYYQSPDATITTDDAPVGTDPVSGLSADHTSAVSVALTAPSSAGTYYYGVCVASVSGESNTDNNCSPGVQVTVGSGGGDDHGDTPSAATDLAVGSSRSGQIETGGDVDYFRVEVAASGELTVHTTGRLDTKGQLEDSAGGVLASDDDGGDGYNFRIAHAVRAGTYYLKVEGYNASTTGRYTIHASGPSGGDGPDLIVASASVSDNTLTPAQSFTLNATVRNQGTAAAAATTVDYYQSPDATITADDAPVGTDPVSGLSADHTRAVSIDLTAPSSAGTYYYGACVASVEGESNTDNNCSTGVQLTVGSPDLIVASASVSDNTLTPAQSFTLNATVRNQGTAAAAATTVDYYQSPDATITTDDAPVGTDPVSGLSADHTRAVSIDLTAPSSAGTYYYGACVASVEGESNTDNNCSTGIQVSVGSGGGPDLNPVDRARTVRMIYFLPNDRPYRQGVVDEMKTMMRRVQTFYAEQMQAHGYGNTTFRFETDARGEPLVHRVDGQHPERHYNDNTTATEVLDEIYSGEGPLQFDVLGNDYLIVIDNSTGTIDVNGYKAGGVAQDYGKRGGLVLVPSSLHFSTVAHELGHTFGLGHDFRDDDYIMSYGGNPDRLSACAAEFLSVHPYFNSDISLGEKHTLTRTDRGYSESHFSGNATVKMITPATYPAGSTKVSVQIKVSDPDGIHQVLLFDTPQGELTGLISCRGRAGEKDTVVELEYDVTIPSSSFPKHVIHVYVVDTDGEVTEDAVVLSETSSYEVAVLPHPASVRSVSFSPDGILLASGSWDDAIRLWDVASRQQVDTLTDHRWWLTSASFSPDGTLLATTGGGDTALLWDVASRQQIDTLPHTDRVHSASFSPDGTLLATITGGGYPGDSVWLWDVASRQQIGTLRYTGNGEQWVNRVSFSPDGTLLATSGDGDTALLWDVASRQQIDTLPHTVRENDWDWVSEVSFSPDGTLLATGGTDGGIWLWDVASRQQIDTLIGHRDTVREVSFSPDGTLLASGSWDGTIQLWDVASRQQIVVFESPGAVDTVSFSPDGTLLASGGSDDTVRLWDVSVWVGEEPTITAAK